MKYLGEYITLHYNIFKYVRLNCLLFQFLYIK